MIRPLGNNTEFDTQTSSGGAGRWPCYSAHAYSRARLTRRNEARFRTERN
jgi:hypothetical protein